jgi:hypothetical protein
MPASKDRDQSKTPGPVKMGEHFLIGRKTGYFKLLRLKIPALGDIADKELIA